MKRLAVFLIAITLFPVLAQNQRQRKTSRPAARSGGGGTHIRPSPSPDSGLVEALAMAKQGRYAEASQRLFQLSYSPRYADQRMQIKYILGLTLQQMKLNQVAAFQYIGVIKEGHNKFVKPSLEKLSIAADALGDDTLLNYAISRINVDEFPRVHRDMLHFRIGEFLLRNKQFDQAAQSFSRVGQGNSLSSNARYQEALALAEAGQLDRAMTAFERLVQARANAPVTDKARVDGIMGKARVLYQKKQWDEAIETYRTVPRDSEFWHDTLFESSWAMLRSGRFRSAMSNFHSLHSSFYENTYLPESLLLRSIVYLYICKYDEMDKTLNLFGRIYKPVYRELEQLVTSAPSNYGHYFDVMNNMMKVDRDSDGKKKSSEIPSIVGQKIAREPDFQAAFSYVRHLVEEKKRIGTIPGGWGNTPIGQYAKKVVNTRLTKAKQKVGKVVHDHLVSIHDEMADLIEQEGFIRYEMLNGRKESLKKKIAGKDAPEQQVDEDHARDFYIQNGYEYWPFRGEYWLDELGNYHYVGTQSCN